MTANVRLGDQGMFTSVQRDPRISSFTKDDSLSGDATNRKGGGIFSVCLYLRDAN